MLHEIHRRLGAIWREAQARDYLFPFRGAMVGSHELTPAAIERLPPGLRAMYEREEARWAGVEAACEWLEREAALYDPTGADDPAGWRDGESATLNGEPREESEAECRMAAE